MATAIFTLTPGTKLGRYAIVAPLGAGGMGQVYRAQDERLQRTVAIKVVSPGVFQGDESRKRFLREALALAKLSHAHIAAVYDVGEQDDTDYIVMEYVPGESLAEKLRGGVLPVVEATSIAMQVAEALGEAHEAGIVHRDLKPGNVMITPKGQVKVLDFGIAKLLTKDTDETQSIATRGVLGTPRYMSPEQLEEREVDSRTDLWCLGVLYYETLAGITPFRGETGMTTMRAILEQPPTPLREWRPDAPAGSEKIVTRALEKNPDARYQTAAEFAADASELLAGMMPAKGGAGTAKHSRGTIAAIATVAMVLLAVGGWWVHRMSKQRWASEEAIPQVTALLADNKPLAAMELLEKAKKYLPRDAQVAQLENDNMRIVSITSSPSNAVVEIQDYAATDEVWHKVGVTPVTNVQIPKGYFRWKVTKPGEADLITAPETAKEMDFPLDAAQKAPAGMVYSPGGGWGDYIGFIGWAGTYKLPAYYVDRYEVTNREYQQFVDSGGYEKRQFWPAQFMEGGKALNWDEEMTRLRDSTGRAGPSTWVGGHYPEGKADYPVAGVSWFEASAYAAFAGNQLPVMAQWFQIAPPEVAAYTVQASNISRTGLAAAGAFKGVGPYGTFDTAGNVREWVANTVGDNLRLILGGSWQSPTYLYLSPEALTPFDRSETNGFLCVRNLGPMPEAAAKPITPVMRDFSHFKTVSDDVFHAYESLYAYAKTPLNATAASVVGETVDWTEEKVSFDAGYRGERMSAYLFLPKNVHPPFQTVLFFPSARVQFLHGSGGGLELGDVKFFDYIIQSGRAVMYPIYQETYERRVKFSMPGGEQNIQITTDWYKDAARSLDYLATRSDIDSSRLGYLGVSMGAADGVIISSLLQDRLKTAIFLDGGYFLEPPPPGGDQADFVVRMKKPVLMVNGRYDFTFSLEKAQNPFFAMLGTPEADKRHVVLETPHDVTEQRPQLTKAVLEWLDHYMGRVGQ
jgi:predicted Ser/Thr protein kinase